MAFTVRGSFAGEPARLTWDGGSVTGDPTQAVELVKRLAGGLDEVGPVGGPTTTADHLDSPLSALALFGRVLEGPWRTEGELPHLPQPPAGAVV